MRTTIDANGRLVIPKSMREALHLERGSDIDLALVDGRIEVRPAPTAMRLERRDDAWVAVTDRDMPTLTVEQVRETLDRVRR